MPPNPFQTAPYPDMLTDLEKNAIRDHYRAISENLPQFRPRAAQREMIAAVANAFARHWGLNQGTTSWTEFASRVHRGSFVALAYSNGKVYHTAFVTEQADVVSDEYGTYRTFAIAQHTRNYEGWVHGNGLASVWKQRGYWITAEGDSNGR